MFPGRDRDVMAVAFASLMSESDNLTVPVRRIQSINVFLSFSRHVEVTADNIEVLNRSVGSSMLKLATGHVS